MRYEPFKLYQKIKSVDTYGNTKDEYEFLQEIAVYLNEQHLKTQGTDNIYFVKAYQGVTPFVGFELGEQYKIENARHVFKITSFICGRLTQIALEEVTQLKKGYRKQAI